MRTFAIAALIGVCALAATACGSEETSNDGPSAKLEFTLEPQGRGGPSQDADLECPGEVSVDQQACEALAGIESAAIEPVPDKQPCTAEFGGADVATIRGTIDGEAIDVRLNRSGGCEIDRFDAWMPVISELYEYYEPGTSAKPPK